MFPLQISSTSVCPGFESRLPDLSRCMVLCFCRQSVASAPIVLGDRGNAPQHNVRSVSSYDGTISSGTRGGAANLIDRCPVPCLKSPHMTTRSCMPVSP